MLDGVMLLWFLLAAASLAVYGYRIAPKARFQIVIGVRAKLPGKFVFRGIRVEYRVGSARYRADFGLSGVVCAPRKTWVGRCHTLES